MKNYLIIILALIVGYFAYDKFTTKESVKTVYTKGKESIKYIHDTVIHIKRFTKTNIKIDTLYKSTDSIPILPVIRSSFVDSTVNYVLNLQAYSVARVDSFKYTISNFLDSIKISQTDTLKIETTIETNTPNWYYIAGSFILGLILAK